MPDQHDRGRPKRSALPPIIEDETTGVQVMALRHEIRHVAETQEIDTRQLHGRISEVAKQVTALQVSNAAQTTTLEHIRKSIDEERAEQRAEREAERERIRIQLVGDEKVRLETARIPRTKLNLRAKIILAAIALVGTGIGAGVKLVSILHGG